jgi:hypothetical protein
LNEIVSKRNWNSKLFDTGRVDEKERPIYGTKLQNGLHDIEPDGSFVDVNTWFQPYSVGVSTDRVIRNRCGEVRVSDTASESKDLAKVKTKNLCGISLKLKGYRTYGPHFDDLKSTYYTTNDGITLKYYPNYKGVNIVIVINNPQIASNVYRFSIQEYGCNYTYEKVEGGIKCISSTGKDDIHINALYVKDANNDYGDVNIDLDGVENGRQIIKKIIAPVWLGNAVGPVELDPNVTIPTGDAAFNWNMIRTFSTVYDRNYSGEFGTPFMNYAAANDINAVIAKVDLSAYVGATVTAGTARFGMNVTLFTGTSLGIEWHELLRSWVTGSSWNTIEAGAVCGRYTVYNTTPWTTLGARGDGTDRNGTPDGSGTITGASDPDYQLPISDSLAQQFIDGTNNGILIDPDDAVTGGYEISSMYYYFEYTAGGGIVFPSIITPKPTILPISTPGTIPGGSSDNTWITN